MLNMRDLEKTVRVVKAILQILLVLEKRKAKRRHRRLGVRPLYQRRLQIRDGHNLLGELRFDREMFFNYTRLSYDRFDYLLGLVGPLLQKKKKMRTVILPNQRLAMTLRFLAVGDCLATLSFAYRCGKSTCSVIIRETLRAIVSVLHSTALPMPSSAEEWKDIASGFWNKWNLPHCLGAIDGKQIQIQSPQASGSLYFNYKKNQSIVLMAAADADYAFIFADVGAEGSLGDSSVIKDSVFGKRLYSKQLNLPDSENLPGSDFPTDYFFVGDGAFQLRNDLMKPFAARRLTLREAIYNCRISRGRRVVENAFGILSSRWRIFKQPLISNVQTADYIVLTAVCLHNFIIRSGDRSAIEKYVPEKYVDCEMDDGSIQRGLWNYHVVGEAGALQRIPQTHARNPSKCATAVREKLADYFSGVGAVDWQERRVREGFWGAYVEGNGVDEPE